MNWILRRLLPALLLATIAAAQAVPVAAETTVTYAIRGFETFATPTEGRFAGVALSADDYGVWLARVVHTPFDANRNAEITGGSFSLNGEVRDVSGSLVGGTVQFTSADPGCGREWFAVSGAMTIAGGGAGSLDVTLTHYRTRIFGRCITYWATVNGATTLTLP